MSTHPLIEEYVDWMRSWGASRKTIDARAGMAADLLNGEGVAGLTTARIQARMAERNRHQRNKELSPWSRATYYGHIHEFCRWLVAAGYLDADPMEGMKRPARPHSLPRPLTEEQAATLLEAADGRTRDWILLAMLAGLRAHEIAKIRGEDVSRENIYVQGKGGTRAAIPTHDQLWAMAQRYPRIGYWFPGRKNPHIGSHTVTVTVSRLFDSLGIDGSIHRCRHSYGTRLLRAGTNVRVVQRLMRHANIETTAIYTAVDEDEMRAGIDRL